MVRLITVRHLLHTSILFMHLWDPDIVFARWGALFIYIHPVNAMDFHACERTGQEKIHVHIKSEGKTAIYLEGGKIV